ncbi:ribosomal RNA small subunit methyltransferase NEP1 [Tribolium castaneum]|uniref:18S rRNA (pseudouridine-N1)-methyltransferase n=1 Tax=Tribolium castaneum TaxID=7070 RepID=D6WR61_TRICA|nr:PREDICTED: ribosomal RNA small subunit methyltransferase NEP1 [Tribolium castaneum]EFA07025.1 Ribosomal RNA small subunit methyltransferase NEP1-like Protein [Tribolium castaneum]|eukprot:XP_975500.1 PREDICTED: ribosomal RNA small subunit methyltransferase NEP1 [Tribolium castaneum]
MGKKRKLKTENDEYEFDPTPKHLTQTHLKNQEKRLIIILEGAQLETVKVGNKFELLNCDDHVSILKNSGRSQALYRPDITHQCLLMLFDSPLNRAGLLQVYVHTENNVLIEINPQTRIPRTFKRFAGLMVQLLHKYSIRAESGPKLLKVIKNPVTDHLPVGIKKYAMSFSSNKTVKCAELVPKNEDPVAVVVGAMARGSVNVDYTEETLSISNYPLSAALTCTKLCSAFEEQWGVH